MPYRWKMSQHEFPLWTWCHLLHWQIKPGWVGEGFVLEQPVGGGVGGVVVGLGGLLGAGLSAVP